MDEQGRRTMPSRNTQAAGHAVAKQHSSTDHNFINYIKKGS